MSRIAGVRRRVYDNERCCVNCRHDGSCFNENELVVRPPHNWSLRTSWHPDDMVPYWKTIFAGICQQYEHNNPAIHAAMVRNQTAVRTEQPEWEQ